MFWIFFYLTFRLLFSLAVLFGFFFPGKYLNFLFENDFIGKEFNPILEIRHYAVCSPPLSLPVNVRSDVEFLDWDSPLLIGFALSKLWGYLIEEAD